MAAEAEPRRRPLIASIVGTRPEAIKMRPVIRALAERGTFDLHVVLTGQHRGIADSLAIPDDVTLHELEVDPTEQSPGELCEAIRFALHGPLAQTAPALVLVQGDTSSALAGALAARDCGISVGHVEAGLRSFDPLDPWPEERNRVAIDRIADLLFAPTPVSAANLSHERPGGRIHVTGNSSIDALMDARAAAPPLGMPAPDDGRRTILVTCHRRENRAERLERIASALRRLTAELPVRILFPLHPNRHVRASIEALLAGAPHVHFLPALGHAGLVALIERCWLILTDSGGLQEEGPALGKPVLVMRAVTERVEAPECSRLVGSDPDRIFAEVAALLEDEALYARMASPSLAYGDGRAGSRIAELIESFLLG